MPRAALGAVFVCCVLQPFSAQAQPRTVSPEWIWVGNQAAEGQTAYFRKEFTVRGRVWSARLIATGDDAVTVYLDGKQVLDHQGWNTTVFKDVTTLFGEGKGNGRHVLAVQGKNGKSAAGVLVRLV